jgi:dipeptidyl aminopeptidase/acylaminoacyl peptidase
VEKIMSCSLSLPRRYRVGLLLITLLVAVPFAPAQETTKRPLRHGDYEGWKTIQSPLLSNDGKYLAYTLLPQDGDGEFIVRHLTANVEHRVPRGRGVMAAAGEEKSDDEDQLPVGPRRVFGGANPFAGAVHQFTPDGKAIVFPLPPTKAALDKAKQEKKSPEEMPRSILAIMDVVTGKITTRIDRAGSFTVVGAGAGILIYKRQDKQEEKAPLPKKKDTKAPSKQGPAPKAYGSDLIVRNLADGVERTIAEVAEYSVTRDGKTLVYAVASKQEDSNGVYMVQPLPGGTATALLSGKGRYSRLTWDEKQTQLVFFSDKEDTAAARPKHKIYHWDLLTMAKPLAAQGQPSGSAAVPAKQDHADAAVDLLGPTPPGIRAGWSISDRGTLGFSPDGSRLYVSTAPERDKSDRSVPAKAAADAASDESRVAVELWHFKDELIQPMQKMRAALEQNKTYRAVYFLKDKTFRQLSDETAQVMPAEAGDFAVGADDRPYRHLTGYGPALSDYALVNVRAGTRQPLLQAAQWAPSFAPTGRCLIAFDGKDWQLATVPDGKKRNLTAKLPVKFVQEQWDQPSEAPAYGVTGWSADGKYVLLNDRYDVWKIAVDGSTAGLLTGGLGRKTHTVLRLVPLPRDDAEQREQGIDLGKPLLFKAVNDATRDEGFYRLEPGAGELKLLVMGARSYGMPIKAKKADTLLLTISSFYDAPDYFVTGPDFREMRRVTDANPQKKNFVWGKAELVHYKNLDGVPLTGMLIKPENFDPHKQYPLLVYIYERLSQNLHRFLAPSAGTSINPSYYASNGYLVFMPDIAYTVGSPGQSALKCVLPGVQAVVDRGCVDEKAIGIQGHSWGGYQIAYMITQTSRFKAAAAGAPVANMISAYDGIRWGTGLPRQFQYERTQSRLGATLWQAPQRFVENSPIFMADRVQTPLLMLHNDQDDAVPWYQGIEYYLALRRLGKECYLFNYNGELHGLRKKANQRDYTVRMQEFFDHHLKGAPQPEWMAKGIPYQPREKEQAKTLSPGS